MSCVVPRIFPRRGTYKLSYRSGIVENTHTGVVCCVKYTTAGEWVVLNSAGDVEQLFYPRSCLKFVQVLPLLESGKAIDDSEFLQ